MNGFREHFYVFPFLTCLQNVKINSFVVKRNFQLGLFCILCDISRYLQEQLHFIDKRRLAVWGWSYGGFIATMLLSNEQKIFNCGVAVSPVVSWKLYGKIFLSGKIISPSR